MRASSGQEVLTMKRVDAHQHFWNLDLVEYPWLTADYGPLRRNYEPPELAPQIAAAGIERTVLVQAADSYAETAYLLSLADRYEWIGAVTGWVPLLKPDEAADALDRYLHHHRFRGVRHLIHTEPDPDWIIQERVIESLRVLARRKVLFEVVAVFPNHLVHVPTLAEQVPDLTIIIDHLAKPPIKDRGWDSWATQLAAAARCPKVSAKISGLNTAAEWTSWTAHDLRPYIDFAIEQFGVDRLMFGSDWPVCILAGDYAKVWEETNRALDRCTHEEREAILGGTAARVYQIA